MLLRPHVLRGVQRLALSTSTRPPLPPFTAETAALKARAAEDAWNSREPDRVALAYTEDTRWRNRSEFIRGREAVRVFLTRKWEREEEYRLIKEVWCHTENRIAVRFVYEYCVRPPQGADPGSQPEWFRAHGNENWQFDKDGLMEERHASINDVPIREEERLFRWPQGRRPDGAPGLTELGL